MTADEELTVLEPPVTTLTVRSGDRPPRPEENDTWVDPLVPVAADDRESDEFEPEPLPDAPEPAQEPLPTAEPQPAEPQPQTDESFVDLLALRAR